MSKRQYPSEIVWVVALLLCGGTLITLVSRKGEKTEGSGVSQRQSIAPAPTIPLPRPDPSRIAKATPDPGAPRQNVNLPAPSADIRPALTNAADPSQATGKPAAQDLMARAVLGLVGMDPAAEEYWIEAINDASLSTAERQDLIEDLNEDGLIDPGGNAIEDLPLIESRIFLIEALAPSAMDEVNAAAFEEAYKDLVNLAEKLGALIVAQ